MKKNTIIYSIIILFVCFVSFYRLDYYIMKPGDAYDVQEFITVQDGDQDDTGSFSLMTVSMFRATPSTYVMAKLREYYEVIAVESIRQEGEDDEEYSVRQLQMMSSSQFNSLYTAFSKSDLDYDVVYDGIFIINILDGGAADGILKPGDELVEVDGEKISNLDIFLEKMDAKKKGDEIQVVVNRKDKLITETLIVKEMPGDEKRVGLGIAFTESKSITTDPKVHVETNDIGGPSAGMMMTLEILNQLTDEDITKGYAIAGTGEMLIDGTIGRIGGIEKKVVAADQAGIEIFLVPDDELPKELLEKDPTLQSNYEVAAETAKNIKTDMEIVPVKTIDDALDYLEQLKAK